MDKKIKFVKVVLWLGIILDAIVAVLYAFPKLMLRPLGISTEMLTPVATYLLFHAGILMLAWTLLLIWTLQKPADRRFVLLLTVLITLGMEASAIYLLTVEGVAKIGIIPLLIMPVIVGGLFTAGYFMVRNTRN